MLITMLGLLASLVMAAIGGVVYNNGNPGLGMSLEATAIIFMIYCGTIEIVMTLKKRIG